MEDYLRSSLSEGRLQYSELSPALAASLRQQQREQRQDGRALGSGAWGPAPQLGGSRQQLRALQGGRGGAQSAGAPRSGSLGPERSSGSSVGAGSRQAAIPGAAKGQAWGQRRHQQAGFGGAASNPLYHMKAERKHQSAT
jgi:hypothetical protein